MKFGGISWRHINVDLLGKKPKEVVGVGVEGGGGEIDVEDEQLEPTGESVR